MDVLLLLPALAHADDTYPVRAVDRPLVLPQGVGRITLDSGLASWSRDEAFESAELRTVLQGAFGLGRVDLGLATSARVAPSPRWDGTIAASARVSVVDAEPIDWAPGLVASVRPWDLCFVVDPGVRWTFADDLTLSLGHGEDPWRVAWFLPGEVVVPLDVALVAQASEQVALSLRTSLGTLNVVQAQLWVPPWDRANGAVGVKVVPADDVDLDGLLGLWWTPARTETGGEAPIEYPPTLGLDLRVGVTTRW